MDMSKNIGNELFFRLTGERVSEVNALPSSGSGRLYFRLKSPHYTCIGVQGNSVEENRAFREMAGHFKKQGLPVPEVYAVSEDGFYYLQEDLGDTDLFGWMAGARKTGIYTPQHLEVLKKTIRLLPHIQVKGARGMDFSCCYPAAEFDRRSIYWDLNYFKYCFLKPSGLEFREDVLEADFDRLAEVLLAESSDTFMYRDFQSRNVMLKEEEPYFIDFQGGRKGPVYYDVASFLWQARAAYPEEVREMLLKEYLESLKTFRPVQEDAFRSRLRHFVLFRILQVLGAYGFRGYFERKSHFIQSVPPALAQLERLLGEEFQECPYLCSLLRKLVKLDRFKSRSEGKGLTVRVYSFSYKKGIPEDDSGNGGGFVFDCRAIRNPGKYEPYKQLTGMDAPVIRFLEENGEIVAFMEHVYALVNASVQRYLERGFTRLSVCFGCTGGQHRSVYAAQHLAEHLHREFGVRVLLVHREQGIEQIFNPLS